MLLPLAAGADVPDRREPPGGHDRPAVRAHSSRPTQPEPVASAIAQLVADPPSVDGFPAHRWRHVRTLYDGRRHRPIWLAERRGGRALGASASTLVDALADAPTQGLRLDGYPWSELRAALSGVQGASPSPAALARADVLLTAALVAHAEDLLTGQVDPRSVNREWHIDPQDVDVDSALTQTLRRESFAEALALLRPQDADYATLMRELDRYRRIVAGGGWPTVPELGVLRPGDVASAGALGTLLGRLHAEGFSGPATLTPAATSTDSAGAARSGTELPAVYDVPLAGAVADYQRRHGLAVDSVIGPNTLASLNRPAEYRLRQLAANLERHRWLPRTRGDRYVIVNVPAFRLRAYDAGREALSMNVVVGAEYGGRTTPVFSDSMAYVVFRPYWNVPQGIAARELWPAQRRDPSYFRRNGYEAVRASWGTYVRQKPGPGNALGHAKFIFPNDFAIYLHDTPARRLFAEQVRAFSHGCIRVEHPDRLAEFVLGPQGWGLERVQDAMERGTDDHRVYLDRKLPVYIVYFTTYGLDGALHFASDVYDRDDALVRAMGRAALPSAELTRQADDLQAMARRVAGAR